MSINFREIKNVGVIAFDMENSPVNLLTADVIKRLDTMLDEVKQKNSLRALVFMSKKRNIFIAGADIKEIEKIVESVDGAIKAKAGQDLMNKIEDITVPTFAVIDGVALGGGCELSLACDYRIATFNEKVRIGLPEINLGFVPGFGGTYRLPRIVGLQEGLKMILSGKPIDGKKALRIGLVDKLFPSTKLEDFVHAYVKDIVESEKIKKKYRRKRKKGLKGFINWFLNENFLGQKIVFNQTLKSVLKLSKGAYPAPVEAVEVIRQNFYCDRPKGMDIEAKAFGGLAITEISKNLVHLFYLSEKFKKLSIDGAKDIKPIKIKKCGVLGAGVMGGGIAQLFSYKGIPVRLKDINYDAVALGFKSASKVFQGLVKRRRMSKAVANAKMAQITGTIDYSGFQSADIVIEAVVEKMEVKQAVFKELSGVVNPQAILATNTSALSVTQMAKAVKDPSKLVGFHFFNPVHRMPLVEVITTDQTSKETTLTALNLVKQLGKTPILVKDSAGFIVNRILLIYLNEAGRILEECGRIEDVDRIMTDFGMPMGPFLLSDEVGMDVGIKVLKILEDAFGARYKPVPIFEKVFEGGFLGKKTQKGFYLHAKKRIVNKDIIDLLDGDYVPLVGLDNESYQERMVFLMINEAARCLEEKIVEGPDAIDVGMIFGAGFPPFRGGLLKYADSIGIDYIVKQLEIFEKELDSNRFAPCSYLVALKEKNQKFYI